MHFELVDLLYLKWVSYVLNIWGNNTSVCREATSQDMKKRRWWLCVVERGLDTPYNTNQLKTPQGKPWNHSTGEGEEDMGIEGQTDWEDIDWDQLGQLCGTKRALKTESIRGVWLWPAYHDRNLQSFKSPSYIV